MTIPIPELFRRTLATTSAVPYCVAIAMALLILALAFGVAVVTSKSRTARRMGDLAEWNRQMNKSEESL